MVLVSVAVITYNMVGYLPALLDSILKQKVSFEYEIIIDDDCSSDNSREIILSYQKRFPEIIKPSFRETNVGGSRNMYGVMQQCQGKYIAILEGDDWWEDENKLQYQIDFLEEHSEYIGMTCNSWCDHGVEAEYCDVMRKRKTPKVFSFKDFQTRNFCTRLPSSTDTWVFRNIFLNCTEYPVFYEAHPMVWDQSLILILYGIGNVYYDPKLVSHHRSISKSYGTNYQSLIRQKNCLYEDSKMYQVLENYIQDELHLACGDFALSRGDVWIEAKFRAMLSKDSTDQEIAQRIWKDQKNKGMLVKLFCMKTMDIIWRKIRK